MVDVPRRRQHGGTILGFMLGLVVGLGIAVFVAIFVTRAPVPFVNKANRSSVAEPKSAAEAPDPNKPMYSRTRPNGTPADGSAPPPTAGLPVPAPAVPAPATSTPVAPPAAAPVTPPQAAAVIKPPEVKTPEARPLDPKAGDTTKDEKASYLLQAGAFRSQGDADGMRAKLALLGFEGRVLTAEVNGQTMYRVRVGPYGQLEDMNRVRAKLAENGIEASVIRQR